MLLFPLVAFSQSKDKKASEILKEVTEKTKSYNSIKLEFTYQMENPEAGINEVTQGNALVSGDKYRLDIAGQTVICNGVTIWTVISDAEEVQVNDAEEGDDGFSLTKMLSTYNEDYDGDVDYAVHHKEPLHTQKTNKGKKDIDIQDNMETIPKNNHVDTHRPCGNSYHKHPFSE